MTPPQAAGCRLSNFLFLSRRKRRGIRPKEIKSEWINMLLFNKEEKKFSRISDSNLKEEEIFESKDFQTAIVNSWEDFALEINIPELQFIGKEVITHDSIKDRIDLLAHDDDGNSIIIELKRGSNKFQLLQALTYAAMIGTWEDSDFLKQMQKSNIDSGIIDSVSESEINKSQKIILIAESFDPEVIITSEWLHSIYGVDVAAFSIRINKTEDNIYLSLEQKFPLPELSDSYEKRKSKKLKATKPSGKTWENVKEWIEYDWGEKVIDWFLKQKAGDPGRARFVSMFPGEHGSLLFVFQKKEFVVYTYKRVENDKEFFANTLSAQCEISTWGSDSSKSQGLRIKIYSEEDVKLLLNWIKTYFPNLLEY